MEDEKEEEQKEEEHMGEEQQGKEVRQGGRGKDNRKIKTRRREKRNDERTGK